MTSVFFLLALLAIGYLLYWTILNDRNAPDSADLGWFGTGRTRPEPASKNRDGASGT